MHNGTCSSYQRLTNTFPYRLSHEFLSGQIAELNKKVKDLDKKSKKSPDDLKAQLKTFLAVSSFSLLQFCT